MSWLKTREAREYLSMKERQFADTVKSGLLTYVKLPSGHHRFHARDLDKYMRQYQVGPKDEIVKAAADQILEGLR